MKELNEKEKEVLLHKKMEVPFLNAYYLLEDDGTYHCKQCNQGLFSSEDKFHSGSGWPCFDRPIQGRVREEKNEDLGKWEAFCSGCGGFLGYVYSGENFTDRQKRYNINSLALRFKPDLI